MGNDMGSKGRVTIREVAERAGVSTATASRALSGNHPVPAATRARVLRAARDLDYVANAHARALVGGGRKMAAVVVRQVTSPFYAQVAEGVEAEAADRGWLCVVGATGGDAQREMEFVQLMREEGARLVILVGGVVEDDAYRERVAHYAHALDSSGARLVLCGRPRPAPRSPRWSSSSTTRPEPAPSPAICCRPGTAGSSSSAGCPATPPSTPASPATGPPSPSTGCHRGPRTSSTADWDAPPATAR